MFVDSAEADDQPVSIPASNTSEAMMYFMIVPLDIPEVYKFQPIRWTNGYLLSAVRVGTIPKTHFHGTRIRSYMIGARVLMICGRTHASNSP